jgi:hypothetical protein
MPVSCDVSIDGIPERCRNDATDNSEVEWKFKLTADLDHSIAPDINFSI